MQIKDLTTTELKALIRETVLEVLEDYLPDPDAGLEIRPEVKQQLFASRQRRANGDHGISAEEAAQRFGTTWQ
jgi:hypothetical protein